MTVTKRTLTLRGLPGGEQTFDLTTAENGVMVVIDGRWICAVDLQYSGLPVGEEIPEDPCDPANRPKAVVGCWPDGEEWERVHQVYFDEPIDDPELVRQLREADNKFHRRAAPAVFAEREAFLATGRYPYDADVVAEIATKYQVGSDDWEIRQKFHHQAAHDFLGRTGNDLLVKLHHEVYLASGEHRVAGMVAKERNLLEQGFRPITEFEPVAGARVTLSDDTAYRVAPGRHDDWVLLAPRKRSNGISLQGLQASYRAFEAAKAAGQFQMGTPSVIMFKKPK